MSSQTVMLKVGSHSDRFAYNVLNFLAEQGTQIALPIKYALCWIVKLSNGSNLHVYEETIDENTAACDQCRIIGWGTHPVCSKRYHFILPAETGPDSLQDPASLVAIAEASFKKQKIPSSIGLPSQAVADDALASGSFTAPTSIFDSSCHRLHGIVHANGFGHLLRVNGREGGSVSLSGRSIVDLWDSLCVGLRVRKVTVEDVSNKGGMELRVLHTAAHGTTWYGRWGYNFGRSAYNVSEQQWERAIEAVSGAKLSGLLHDATGLDPDLEKIIQRYRLPLGPVPIKIDKLGILLCRMLYFVSHPDEASDFFDEPLVEACDAVWKSEERLEAAKRAESTVLKGVKQSTKNRSALTAAKKEVAEANRQLKMAEAAFSSLRSGAAPGNNNKAGTSNTGGLKVKIRMKTDGAGPSQTAAQKQQPKAVSPKKPIHTVKLKLAPARKQDEQLAIAAADTKVKMEDTHGGASTSSPRKRPLEVATQQQQNQDDSVDLNMAKRPRRAAAAAVAVFKEEEEDEPELQPVTDIFISDNPEGDALEDYNELIVGRKVRVWWPDHRGFYVGQITEFLANGLHRVRYRASSADHDMRTTKWRWLENPPPGSKQKQQQPQKEEKQQAAAPKPEEPVAVPQQKTPAVETTTVRQPRRTPAPDIVKKEQKNVEDAKQSAVPQEVAGFVRETRHSSRLPPPAPNDTSKQGTNTLTNKTDQRQVREAERKTKVEYTHINVDVAAALADKLPNLHYQAKGARDDTTERARQLSRALRALMPASKEVLGNSKGNKREMEEGFARFCMDDVPAPLYGDLWHQYLKNFLNWAQEVVGKPAKAAYASSVIKTVGEEIIVNRQTLHKLGLYPETWPMPITAKTLKQANDQAVKLAKNPERAVDSQKVTNEVAKKAEQANGVVENNKRNEPRSPRVSSREPRQQQQKPPTSPRQMSPRRETRARSAALTPPPEAAKGLPKVKVSVQANGLSLASVKISVPNSKNYDQSQQQQQPEPRVTRLRSTPPPASLVAAVGNGPLPTAPRQQQTRARTGTPGAAEQQQAPGGRQMLTRNARNELVQQQIKEAKKGPSNAQSGAALKDRSLAPPSDAQLEAAALAVASATMPLPNQARGGRASLGGNASASPPGVNPLALQQYMQQLQANNSAVYGSPRPNALPAGLPIAMINGVPVLRSPGGLPIMPPLRSGGGPVSPLPASNAAGLALNRPGGNALIASPSQAAASQQETWRLLLPGRPLPDTLRRDARAVRDRVFRDIVHVFYAVLRVYSPEVALDAAIRKAIDLGEFSTVSRNFKLKSLVDAAGVLRDAKHFLKECSGDKLTEAPYPPEGTIRVLCKLALPPQLSEPPASTTRFGRKFLPVDPPPELLLLPHNATLSALLEAATKAYRGTYHMLKDFQAETVVSGLLLGPKGSVKAFNAAAPLVSLLPNTACDFKKQPPLVVLAGRGVDMDAVWQHAGGPEDWIVACPCGTRDDDGEAMVECEMCNMWMHTRCVGVEEEGHGFTCNNCAKRQKTSMV